MCPKPECVLTCHPPACGGVLVENDRKERSRTVFYAVYGAFLGVVAVVGNVYLHLESRNDRRSPSPYPPPSFWRAKPRQRGVSGGGLHLRLGNAPDE